MSDFDLSPSSAPSAPTSLSDMEKLELFRFREAEKLRKEAEAAARFAAIEDRLALVEAATAEQAIEDEPEALGDDPKKAAAKEKVAAVKPASVKVVENAAPTKRNIRWL